MHWSWQTQLMGHKEWNTTERLNNNKLCISIIIPKKDVLLIIGDWNEKVGSQETPGVTGNFGLGVQTEGGQRLIEF